MAPTVFISYSHHDNRWKERLVRQLVVLEREGLLETWDDSRIHAGDDWLPAIEAAIAKARVAVLIVSADFLDSEFVRSKEIPDLMERRRREGLRVIPLIARPCAWQSVPWLAAIQARPLGDKTLAGLSGAKAEQVLSDLAKEILALVETMPRTPVGSVTLRKRRSGERQTSRPADSGLHAPGWRNGDAVSEDSEVPQPAAGVGGSRQSAGIAGDGNLQIQAQDVTINVGRQRRPIGPRQRRFWKLGLAVAVAAVVAMLVVGFTGLWPRPAPGPVLELVPGWEVLEHLPRLTDRPPAWRLLLRIKIGDAVVEVPRLTWQRILIGDRAAVSEAAQSNEAVTQLGGSATDADERKAIEELSRQPPRMVFTPRLLAGEAFSIDFVHGAITERVGSDTIRAPSGVQVVFLLGQRSPAAASAAP